MLQTQQLTVGYGRDAVVAGVTIAVQPGQIVTLIGPNGAGKSTILKTIAGQLAPVAGTVYVHGQNIADMGEAQLAKELSILMTDRIHPELMTCEELVQAGRYPYTGRLGILSREDKQKVEEAMELVHVAELRDRDFNRISDGQRQRVLLARAICQQPQVLILDEPTSFLDIRHKLELLSLLKRLVREKQLAVVLSLHELDLAQKVSDLVVCIADGRVDRVDSPDAVFCGDYIHRLYGMTVGSFQGHSGSVELEKQNGAPQVFVIGGGGSGIAIYRQLQRAGIPFATGVLHTNDIEYPVAQALAVKVITEAAFEPVGAEALQQATEILLQCKRVICTVDDFGTMNNGNRQLLELAEEKGILCQTITE